MPEEALFVMSGFSDDSFRLPSFYKFKPFYTLQPVQATREKQLKLWRDLIISYHRHHGQYRMADPLSWPLFHNKEIDRHLGAEGIRAVVDSLLETGLAEWEDPTDESSSGALLIMLKSSDALAQEVYEWATRENLIGNVATIYEVLEGDECSDSPFKGLDVSVLKKALAVLQTSGRCLVLQGSSDLETGIKFV